MLLPSGIFSTTYEQDMGIFKTKTRWGLFLLFLVLLYLFPLYASNYLISFVTVSAITIVSVYGLNILTGYCGQLSMGHAAFMGVGAYISGILMVRLQFPWILAFLCAGVGSGIVGIIFGLAALRIKGFYLAVSTLAAQFILCWAFINLRWLTGGSEGLKVPPPSIAGFVFDTERSQFLLIITVCVIIAYLCKNISRTRVGRAFVAVRDNDLAAEVIGINLRFYKPLAFFVCCVFAGFAGSLWGHYIGLVTSDQFTLDNSIVYLAMLIIGGMGSNVGVIFGVFFMQLLHEASVIISPILSGIWINLGAQFFSALLIALYAVGIILFLIFEPRGLYHRWEILWRSYRLYPYSY